MSLLTLLIRLPALLATAFVLTALPGCSTFDGPVPLRDRVFVEVILPDDLPINVNGRYQCDPTGDYCTLYIKRSTYPYCVAHEIRHAFEGNFHGNAWSTEDCHN